MYKLYFMPGACSLAVHTLLNELNQPVEIVDKRKITDYDQINPNGMVPVLVDGDKVLREGAAIITYLLDKHQSDMLPAGGEKRAQVMQWIMFANATMHPAYGRLFFTAQNILDEKGKEQAFAAAAGIINRLWQTVDAQLAKTSFVCGDKLTAADIMLTVYSAWGQYFPVAITLGANVERMIERVKSLPSFQKAVQAEQVAAAA